MIIQSVGAKRGYKFYQCGFTLVELMVASMLSLLVIALIGSIFISTQRSALSLSRELMLSQNLSSAMLQLKEDIERAGYNSDAGFSLRLSGADDIIHVQSSALGYVYYQPSSTSEPFFHVVYRLEALPNSQHSLTPQSNLKVCEKSSAQILTMVSAALSQVGSYCYAVFDPELMNITQFTLTNHNIAGSSLRRQFIQVSVSAHLLKWPEVTQNLSLTLHSGNKLPSGNGS